MAAQLWRPQKAVNRCSFARPHAGPDETANWHAREILTAPGKGAVFFVHLCAELLQATFDRSMQGAVDYYAILGEMAEQERERLGIFARRQFIRNRADRFEGAPID